MNNSFLHISTHSEFLKRFLEILLLQERNHLCINFLYSPIEIKYPNPTLSWFSFLGSSPRRSLPALSLSDLFILQWRHRFCTAPINQTWILQLRQTTGRKRIYWSGFAKNAIANVLKVVPVNSNSNFQLPQHVPHTAYLLYASCIQLYFLFSKSKVRHL